MVWRVAQGYAYAKAGAGVSGDKIPITVFFNFAVMNFPVFYEYLDLDMHIYNVISPSKQVIPLKQILFHKICSGEHLQS